MPAHRSSTRHTSIVNNGDVTINNENRNSMNSTMMSEYELLRQQKIQRNQEKLRSLGLLTLKDESTAAQKPSKMTGAQEPLQHHETNHKKRTSRSSEQVKQHPPLRRVSLRLRGIDPFPTGRKNSNQRHSRPTLSDGTLKEATTISGKTAANWNEASTRTVNTKQSSTSSSNKTTTKEHCQMRIRTMTIPQLQQRIRIIERARGEHCITKLSIMYECCTDANLYVLAEQANDAIQRLTKTT